MHRLIKLAALDAAKEFGQAIVAEVEGGREKALEDPIGRFAEFIEGHSVRDDGIVMRPNRTTMIAQWIEDPFFLGDGAPSPAGKHIGAHEAITNSTGALLGYHAGKKKMPRIRGDYLDLLFAAVERERVKASPRHPERFFKPLRHFRGVFLQLVGGFDVAEGSQQRRHPVLGLVNIALYFAQRDGRLGDLTVAMQDGIP